MIIYLPIARNISGSSLQTSHTPGMFEEINTFKSK